MRYDRFATTFLAGAALQGCTMRSSLTGQNVNGGNLGILPYALGKTLHTIRIRTPPNGLYLQ